MHFYVLHHIRWSRICAPEVRVGNPGGRSGWRPHGFLEAGIGGAIDVMTTSGTVLATSITAGTGITSGAVAGSQPETLRIVMLLITLVLAARFVTWLANRVTAPRPGVLPKATRWCARRQPSTARQPASVISWVSIVSSMSSLCAGHRCVASSVGALVGPAAVARRRAGLRCAWCGTYAGSSSSCWRSSTGSTIWSELSMVGSRRARPAQWRDVTLRVTKLRSSEGGVHRSQREHRQSSNLSKDWARGRGHPPSPTSADLGRVNEMPSGCEHAPRLAAGESCCSDEPTVMGVGASVDTVTLRLVARTYPASSSRRAGGANCC